MTATGGDVRSSAPIGRRPPDRVRLRWVLIGAGAVVFCSLPILLLGTRVDTWAERVLESTTGAAGVAGLVVALLGLDTVLPVPSSVLATVAGQRLGFVTASAAIGAGLCLGNVLGYLIGRLAGAPVVERVVGRDRRAWARAGSRPGVITLFLTRPVPILSEAAVVLAGAARAPVGRTAAVCGLANVGLAVVYAGVGSAAHGRFALPLGLAGVVGVPALAVAALAVVDARRRGGTRPLAAADEPAP